MKSNNLREMNEISIESITEESSEQEENCDKFKCDDDSCGGNCLNDWEQSIYKNAKDVLTS